MPIVWNNSVWGHCISSCSSLFLYNYSDVGPFFLQQANIHKAQLQWSHVTASIEAKVDFKIKYNINLVRRMILPRDWLKTEHSVINLSWINCARWPTASPMRSVFQHSQCWAALCTQVAVGPSKHGAIVGLWLRCTSGLHCLLKTIFLEFEKKRIGMFR